MKTKTEPGYLEAAIIGDSHAMSVWKHLAPAIRFRQTMTAPAKHFDGRFFDMIDGRPHISADHLREAFPRAKDDMIEVMARARARLDDQLQAIVAAGLPVVSSLGSASYRFARRVAATDPESGQVHSGKILRAAAARHVEHFVAFHEALRPHVPSITFMLGASRFPDAQKPTWLAHDRVISEALAKVGVDVIDIRAECGDADLRLLPEYEADDALHGNGRWCDLVAERIFRSVGHPATA